MTSISTTQKTSKRSLTFNKSFLLSIFISLYLITKFQLTREQNKFTKKFADLPQAKIELAKTQKINKEIIVNTPNFNF